LPLHSAPSVVYPLGRSRFQAQLVMAVWLLGVLVTGVWWLLLPRLDWRLGLGVAAVAAAGLAALSGWKNSPSGQLRWDGQIWRWESHGYQAGEATHEVAVLADFQQVMLLRVENQAHASLWLWAERKAFPERWMDLRRAVYARPRAPGLPRTDGTAGEADAPPVAVSTPVTRDFLPPHP
jgi:toxin CptA